jgi:mannan endo-1,4-beta-mannosidase
MLPVERDHGAPRLLVGGRPFHFLLCNAFYLQEEAARGRLDFVDETLAKCRRLGARVVRAWAFNDDPAKHDTQIQRAPLDYTAAGLAGVDRLLARARAHGLRLVLPLCNFWDAYGGARQWLRWQGVDDAVEGDPRFFTDARVRDHYAAHVAALLERKNPLTGLRWGEDPVVLAWELMNEPRGEIGEWAAFAAATVRCHARQLIAVGDEDAFCCDAADLVTSHFYPEKWGVPAADEVDAGVRRIAAHATRAAAAGRPLLVDEFGISAAAGLARRRAAYRAWLAAAAAAPAVAGIGPWGFAYDARPAGWDEFTFYLRDGRPVDDPDNGGAEVMIEAAARYADADSADEPPPQR